MRYALDVSITSILLPPPRSDFQSHPGFQILQDAPAGWSVVFYCTGVTNLEGLSVPWILEALKLLETLKTLWEGGSSRCRKIIVYGANSLTLVLYQRVSSLLAVSNGKFGSYLNDFR